MHPILRCHGRMSIGRDLATGSDAPANPARSVRCCSGVGHRRCFLEEVRGDGAGERAPAQEVLVVRAYAVADAGAEPRGLELPVLIQPRTVCSWAPMRPATSATVSSWSARGASTASWLLALGHDPAGAPNRCTSSTAPSDQVRARTECRSRPATDRRFSRATSAASQRRRRASTAGEDGGNMARGDAGRWASTSRRSGRQP